jgi:hypothetical protein
LSKGSRIPVIYLPDEPGRNATGWSWLQPLMIFVVGAIFTGVALGGTAIVLPDLRKRFDKLELRRSRKARPAAT